jgi:hypothetical protein
LAACTSPAERDCPSVQPLSVQKLWSVVTFPNFEDRAAAENQIVEMSEGAGTAHPRRSIEISVAGPHQRGFRGISVGTVGLGTKAVERSQFAGRLDFENRTIARAPAIAGGSRWRFPLGPLTSPASGSSPSVRYPALLRCEQRLCKVVNLSAGVISKTVPVEWLAPPLAVVP